MSSKKEHLDIISANFRVIEHLTNPSPDAYTTWSIIIIYYMALHYIHAYLAQESDYHPSDHSNLQTAIGTDTNLKRIYGLYRNLQDDSRDARYWGKAFSVYAMRDDQLRKFKKIQHAVCTLINVPIQEELDLYKLFPLNQ